MTIRWLQISVALLAINCCNGQSYGQSYGTSRRLNSYQPAPSPYYASNRGGTPTLAQQYQWPRPSSSGGAQSWQTSGGSAGGAPVSYQQQPVQQQAMPSSYMTQQQQMAPQQIMPQQWSSNAQYASAPQQSGYQQPGGGSPWQQQQQMQQQPMQQGQQGQAGQQNPFNVAPSNVVIEQPPPPKVIFMPPEVHYGPPPPELLEQQTKTVLMCKGTPHTVMGDHQYYSCCNDKLYYWKTELCEDGIVRPSSSETTAEQTTQPPPTPAPVLEVQSATESPVTSLNCSGSTFYVATSERSHYACCGRTLFDMRTSTCNIDGGTTTVGPSSVVQQQNVIKPQQACPMNFLCCDGYTPIPNGDDRYQCCPGAGPYDTTTQQCVPM